MLKIHNSLLRDKQLFAPIEPGLVRMYVCGMTVYDYCHLGHARVLVVFDMVARWLRASGYRVVYVRNITDIDDKIIRRAQENGESIHTLTDRYIAFMHEDAAALGVQEPDHEPRATRYVAASSQFQSDPMYGSTLVSGKSSPRAIRSPTSASAVSSVNRGMSHRYGRRTASARTTSASTRTGSASGDQRSHVVRCLAAAADCSSGGAFSRVLVCGRRVIISLGIHSRGQRSAAPFGAYDSWAELIEPVARRL